jgi:hypothetical protein
MSNFELEPDKELPWNERFDDVDELVGHKILAAFHEPSNKHGEYGAAGLVLVTQTGCWITLDAEADGCGEDPTVMIRKTSQYRTETLHDFVNARALHTAGVINSGEYEVLAKVEADLLTEKNNRRAENLRRQLAALGQE